jgi:hypothetical protein
MIMDQIKIYNEVKHTLAFWTCRPLFSSFMHTVDVRTSVWFHRKDYKSDILIMNTRMWMLEGDNSYSSQ